MRVAWAIALIALLGAGCSDDTTPADTGVDQGADAALPDSAVEAGLPDAGGDLLAQGPYTVGAVQLSMESKDSVDGCVGEATTCPLVTLVKQAAAKGAKLVVSPDYGAYLGTPAAAEVDPAVGDRPASDSRWPAGTVTRTMADLAVSEQIWLTFHVRTQVSGVALPYHATVALDPQGVVRAVHHKYQLGGDEPGSLQTGDSLDTSFFDSPLGKTGLMSSAEAQCFVVDGNVGSACTAEASAMYAKYLAQKPDAALFSAWWFGTPATEWQAPNVMSAVASRLGAWLVVGNGTKTPYGHGGGVWAPDGSEHKVEQPTTATVIIADLPARGTWTPPDAGPDALSPDAGTLPDATAKDSSAVEAGTDA